MPSHHQSEDDDVDEVGEGEVEGPEDFDASRVGTDSIELGLGGGDLVGEGGEGLFEGGGGRVGAL